jgi:hypothetical protein
MKSRRAWVARETVAGHSERPTKRPALLIGERTVDVGNGRPMALVAALHDGLADAGTGRPPYFWTIVTNRTDRTGRLRRVIHDEVSCARFPRPCRDRPEVPGAQPSVI